MSKDKIMTQVKLTAVIAVTGALGFASMNAALASKTHTVSEKGKAFSAKMLEVAVGDTVSFVNDDDIKHNVLISKMKFDSGLQDMGAQTDVAFDKAGKFKVRCAIHPKMKMTVVAK